MNPPASSAPADPATLWRIWFDGAAHPNPGRIGLGAVLLGPAGQRVDFCGLAPDHGCNNEAELLAVAKALELARDAGARHAFHVLLRLPGAVEGVFAERLRAAFPDRADKVLSLLGQMRGGTVKDARFHHRMRGSGPRWQIVADLFARTARRLGLTPPPRPIEPSPFRRPNQQGWLFGSG